MLNTLLCGPILRRTEAARVCIWFATSIAPTGADVLVCPMLKGADRKWVKGPPLPVVTMPNVHQLGANLFVVLLEVRPLAGTFTALTPYGYDVSFQFRKEDKVIRNAKDASSKDGGPKEFLLSKEFNDKGQLSYGKLPLPVFVIPDPATPSAQILYGSCRKAHGPGTDALDAGDRLLEEQWEAYRTSSKGTVPAFSLFMLGDQIYADDLIEELFDAVKVMAPLLMGYDETIPEFSGSRDITYADLVDFLNKYEAGNSSYRIEDLNLPAKVSYHDSSTPNYRRRNVERFFQAYFNVPNAPVAVLVEAILAGEFEIPAAAFTARGLRNLPLTDLNEILPREYLRSTVPVREKRVEDIPYHDGPYGAVLGRKSFLRANSSISTVDDGHALSFGEFAALYVLNWGAYQLATPGTVAYGKLLPLTYVPLRLTVERDDNKANLEGVLERNRWAARLFANLPTYMIFDDHEITDEWNYDDVWRDAVEKRSVTGRRMIANGLAAYWAFQAWGNNPAAFSPAFIKTIKEHLLAPLSTKREDTGKAKTFEDTVLGFQDWAFTAPTNPLSVFLDTRTLRAAEEPMTYQPELNDNKRFRAVRLMSKVAFERVAKLLVAAKYKAGSPIIFCAPTPVIGSKLFELGQLQMVDDTFNMATVLAGLVPRKPGRLDNDFESWSSNPRGKYELFNFIDTVVKPSTVVFLSGDVHYAFHATGELVSAVTGRKYAVEQFTSSALKNNTLDKIKDINTLAYLSLQETHRKEYKRTSETYPVPESAPLRPHFLLEAHLVRYSHLLDADTWLIFTNNLGVLNVIDHKTSQKFDHYFVSSPALTAPFVKSVSLGVGPPLVPWIRDF